MNARARRLAFIALAVASGFALASCSSSSSSPPTGSPAVDAGAVAEGGAAQGMPDSTSAAATCNFACGPHPCIAATVAQQLVSPISLTVAAGKVFWIDQRIAHAASACGGAITDLGKAFNVTTFRGTAADSQNFYFSAIPETVPELHAIPVGGGPDRVLYTAPAPSASDLFIIAAGGFVYTGEDDGLVQIDPTTGVSRLIPGTNTGTDECVVLAVDASAVYCAVQQLNEAATVKRVPLDGSPATTIIPANALPIFPQIVGAVDATTLYLALGDREQKTASFFRAPLAGGPVAKLADRIPVALLDHIDVSARGIVYAAPLAGDSEAFGPSVLPFDGSPAIALATSYITNFATDNDVVYGLGGGNIDAFLP